MSELSVALSDVRKSYRLIWAYQRRIMDIVQAVADRFPQLEFYAWSPLETDRPVQLTTNPLRKWAWDTLPFYKVSFLFKLSGHDSTDLQSGDWLLEIHIDSDDVTFDEYRGEPDASKFPNADTGSSTLAFYIWQCIEDTKANWYRDLWMHSSWPDEVGKITTLTDHPVRVAALRHDLVTLPDRDAVERAVADLKSFLQTAFGISTVNSESAV